MTENCKIKHKDLEKAFLELLNENKPVDSTALNASSKFALLAHNLQGVWYFLYIFGGTLCTRKWQHNGEFFLSANELACAG